MPHRVLITAIVLLSLTPAAASADDQPFEYRVLATSKTSTMQEEMQEAADAGFRYAATMGGTTAFGGSEVVVVMSRAAGASPRFEYRLLATSTTSRMQKELQQAADAGFEYVGQTVFGSAFGGREVACILERARDGAAKRRYDYRLLATTKTSTMQKELSDAGEQGYEVVGLTVADTLVGGAELVTITRRRVER